MKYVFRIYTKEKPDGFIVWIQAESMIEAGHLIDEEYPLAIRREFIG